MKRLGLIGVGSWGRRYIDTVSRRTDCQIAGFARASSGAGFAIPGAVQSKDPQALLDLVASGQIDAVIIATTPQSQAELALATMRLGIPALVEKPLGLGSQAVQSILQICRQLPNPPPLVVDYIHLYAPAYGALKARALASDVPGCPIATIELIGCNQGPYRGWSSLYDYGVHEIAMALDLIGVDAPFVLRGAHKVSSNPGNEGELFDVRFDLGTTSVMARFGNGASTKTRRLTVTLTDGRTLIYDDCKPPPAKLTDAGKPVPIDLTQPLDAVLSHFLANCEHWANNRALPEPVSVSLELSLRIAEILDSIAAAIQ